MAVVRRGKVWQVQVRVGKDPATGRWIRRAATCDSRAEAERVERQLLVEADRDRARFIEPTTQTVALFAAQWLEDRKRDLRPRTWARYDTLLRRHVLPVVGDTTLPNLSPSVVQRLLSDLSDGHGAAAVVLSPRTVAFTRAVLRTMLQDAVRLGVVAANVVDRTRPPKQAPKQVTAFTLDEADALFATADGERLAPLFRFAYWSGLRRGEALALQWADLDMDRATVIVRRSYVQVRGRAFLQEVTKTAAGYRTITLPQATIAALLLQQSQQTKDRLAAGDQWQDGGWVFTTGTGGLLLPSNVYRDYARIRDRAGVPRPAALGGVRAACGWRASGDRFQEDWSQERRPNRRHIRAPAGGGRPRSGGPGGCFRGS